MRKRVEGVERERGEREEKESETGWINFQAH